MGYSSKGKQDPQEKRQSLYWPPALLLKAYFALYFAFLLCFLINLPNLSDQIIFIYDSK
jgi:hypothetical protein